MRSINEFSFYIADPYTTDYNYQNILCLFPFPQSRRMSEHALRLSRLGVSPDNERSIVCCLQIFTLQKPKLINTEARLSKPKIESDVCLLLIRVTFLFLTQTI